jgi:hypothetical protein
MYTIQNLRKLFPNTSFETMAPEICLDFCSYIDYLGYVGKKAFGIQMMLLK